MLKGLTRFSSSTPIVEFGRIVPIKAPKSDSVYLGLDPVHFSDSLLASTCSDLQIVYKSGSLDTVSVA